MVSARQQPKPAALIRGAAGRIKYAERSQLIQIYDQYRALSNDQIRRAVIERNRIDILAREILGYTVTPGHLKMMQFQFLHRDSLQLAYRGFGKCLGLGTPVMMHDGSTKAVEYIQTGDLLMGPDSEPREVLSTTLGRGPLFRIEPTKGDPWVCNDVHMLTLLGRGRHTGEVVDVSVRGVLAEAKRCRCGVRDLPWRLFRVDPKTFRVCRKTHFEAKPLGEGEYAGFELSGDGRFLLGDFTVTHNTTVLTVTKAIHYLIKDRDFRILLASKTKGNAGGFLKEIRGHLENNQRLIEVFGPFYDPSRVSKWDNTEIEILGKKKATKEASITCVGVDSAVVSRHYDAIIGDDLVDDANARTHYMREVTRVFYYQTLLPTLEPPDPAVPHRGENHKHGTRYHFAELYGHLIENELKEHHQIIPAFDEEERSPWPEKHPPEWFKERRRQMGTILFNCQYQNNTDAMKGEIFQYDDCQQIDEVDYPKLEDMKIFAGVDLAISEDEENDQFAIVTLGMVGKFDAPTIYVLDYFAGRLRFSEQTDKIVEHYKRWQPIRLGIEANAYQAAQYHQLREKHPELRVRPLTTDKDKVTRAWKLSAHFEDGRVFFKKNVHGPIIDQLVLFPHFRYKDLFDAFDLAVTISRKRGTRKRRREPGLI